MLPAIDNYKFLETQGVIKVVHIRSFEKIVRGFFSAIGANLLSRKRDSVYICIIHIQI